MSGTPFMQLYVGDYLSDTLHLTTEQHGAYLLLLMTMWRAGAELPNDPAKLARICRVSPKRWPSIWSEIEGFFTVEDGTVRNARLTKEHQKAVSISQERKTAGKKGGEAKALKDKEAALANATAEPQHSQKSESYREVEVGKPTSWPFSAFWSVWPHKLAKSAAEKAWAKMPEADRQAAIECLGDWLPWWRAQNPRASPIHPATFLNAKRWQDDTSQLLNGSGYGNGDRNAAISGGSAHRPNAAFEQIARLARPHPA